MSVKKNLLFIMSLTLFISNIIYIPRATAKAALSIDSKTAVLIENNSGRILYEKNKDKEMIPASITKIMTLNLIFDALSSKKIKLTDEVTTSEYAASMGGSQVFLEPGEAQNVETMIKCISIASANDAAVSMAEFVAGSETEFVKLMNQKAQKLGMKHTHFKNCNGLDEDGHITSAYDVAVMSRALMQHEKIFDYTLIWIDYVRDGQTQLVNTNKLVRTYDGILGLKTGTTSAAGSCISAAAERNGMRLIAVVLGAENTKDRFSAASSLLDYGFVNWKLTTPELPELPELPVTGGMVSAVSLECEAPSGVLTASGGAEIGIKLILPENVPAPVEPGNVLGTAEVALNGDTVQSLKITAKTEAPAITFSSALQYFLACFFAAEAA